MGFRLRANLFRHRLTVLWWRWVLLNRRLGLIGWLSLAFIYAISLISLSVPLGRGGDGQADGQRTV